jgi:mevalonate kinase
MPATKNNSENHIFHSKIMLFGEYSIILGSMGLTIPYAHFNGSLGFINKNRYTDLDFARRSNGLLAEYMIYIKGLEKDNTLPEGFNLNQLEKDITQGLYFESTIPEGYGLGSSGALVAALYHRYMNMDSTPRRAGENGDTIKLKKNLAILESWFHGTSSGIDPLICYMKHPLLITDQQNIKAVGIPRYNLNPDDAIFIINSGNPGKTAPLVEQFMKDCKRPEYMHLMQNDYIPLNNNCIHHLVNGDLDKFSETLRELSLFQATHFNHLIPGSLDREWVYGISTGEYFLKLCGSGGGGFVLGFTREYTEVKKRFSLQNIEIIPVYQAEKAG